MYGARCMPGGYYVAADNPRDLEDCARLITSNGYLCFDTETDTGMNAWASTASIQCISIYCRPITYLFNFEHPGIPQTSKDEFKKILGPYFSDPNIKRVGFNLSYDYHYLEETLGIPCGEMYWDSSVGIWLLHENEISKKLKDLSGKYLGISGVTYEELFKKTEWKDADPTVAAYYALKDAELHWKMFEWQLAEIQKNPDLERLMFEIEMPTQNLYYKTEREGLLVDVDYLVNKVGKELREELDNVEIMLQNMGVPKDVNLDSPLQVANFLFDTLGLPEIKGRSTNEEVLEKLKSHTAIAEVLLERRGLVKLLNTYVDAINIRTVGGRIHPSFRAIGTETGRSTSNNPNLQNIPTRSGPLIRKAFLAPQDYFIVSKDFSGQELRIQAHFAREIGIDFDHFYDEVAAVFFGGVASDYSKHGPKKDKRDLAKIAVLALSYGANAYKLALVLGCNEARAQALLTNFYAKYPGFKEYQRRVIAFAKNRGYVQTILGRKKHADFNRQLSRGQRAALERETINGPVQGSAADQTKKAFVEVARFLADRQYKSRVLLTIHDEIILLAHKDEWTQELSDEIDQIMVNAIPFRVPMKVSTTVYKDRWEGDTLEEAA